MNNSEIMKMHEAFTQHSTRCKCGHTMLIASKDGKAICRWCHNYVFVNKEAEIRYRNKEMLLKARKELNERNG